jgi:putative two-component system response regulator
MALHGRSPRRPPPDGLRADEIPLVGRICAICDVFDALSARRSYKEPWAFNRVVKEIIRKRGTHFDPRLVDAFLRIMPELEREHDLAMSQTPSTYAQQALGHEIAARHAHFAERSRS